MRNNLNDCDRGIEHTHKKKNELDVFIKRELEESKHELFNKITKMLDNLRNQQAEQKANNLKLQQEISILKKEKLDLYQKTTNLQRRITDMENTIGYETKN